MKKIASIISTVAAVAIVATLSSCKKNYTCECCVDCVGTGEICTSETRKLKKKEAQEWCDEGETSSGGCTTSCTLK